MPLDCLAMTMSLPHVIINTDPTLLYLCLHTGSKPPFPCVPGTCLTVRTSNDKGKDTDLNTQNEGDSADSWLNLTDSYYQQWLLLRLLSSYLKMSFCPCFCGSKHVKSRHVGQNIEDSSLPPRWPGNVSSAFFYILRDADVFCDCHRLHGIDKVKCKNVVWNLIDLAIFPMKKWNGWAYKVAVKTAYGISLI